MIICKLRKNKNAATGLGEMRSDGNVTQPKQSIDIWNNPVCIALCILDNDTLRL